MTLASIFRRRTASDSARELALIGHEKHRERVKAVARQICAEMRRPIPEALQ